MRTTVYDAVIVGGGPVGLWLSCELRLAGLDVCVIERRSKRMEQSRALSIHGRTLEVFAMRGLVQRFLSRGTPVPTGHFALLKTGLNFSSFDSEYPYWLSLPQAGTEQLIEDHACALGVVMYRGWTVTHVAQNEDSAWVDAQASGNTIRIVGHYLVGTDGARSVVRRQTGIDFPGIASTHTLMLGDVELEEPPAQPLLRVVNEAGSLMMGPLGNGKHHRIVLFDEQRGYVPTTQPVELDELLQGMRRIIGTDCGARNPVWLSRFSDETRLAKTYRVGNIFLAGDAAHIHMPAGGQGMNVGIQDAMNLGWKLAAVAKGMASAALLNSYELERRPVGARLCDNTLAQTALITQITPATLALRTLLEEKVMQYPSLHREIAGEIAGFTVRYPQTLLTEPAEVTPADGIVGQRIANFPVELDNGVSTTLFELLSRGQWISLGFGDVTPLAAPEWLSSECVDRIQTRQCRAAKLSGIGALLVRPDGHCAAATHVG